MSAKKTTHALIPFAIPAVLGYFLPFAPVGPGADPTWMATGALLLVLAGATAVLLVRRRLPRRLYLVPPLAYIGVVAALRAAVAGSNPSYAALFLLPVAWLAMHGTRTEMLVAAAGALMGSGPFQPEGWIEGALPQMLVGPVIAFTVLRLVTKIRRQAAVIEELAQKDSLTGAVTQRAWVELFDREIVRAVRARESLSVALLDVDDLAGFNRRFGPQAGDDLLKSSVAAWRRALRAGDVLGRIDEDTFGVVLPSCSDEGARIVVERMRVATAELQTCSIGVAEWRPGESREHVMYRVRSALRTAKDEGGDRVAVASINVPAEEQRTPPEQPVHFDAPEPEASPEAEALDGDDTGESLAMRLLLRELSRAH